jgi:hypothetical protein
VIRVVLGHLDRSLTVSVTGSRVLFIGTQLLVDGKPIVRKAVAPRDTWVDEHGRRWNTIDFHDVEVRERTAEDDAVDDVADAAKEPAA